MNSMPTFKVGIIWRVNENARAARGELLSTTQRVVKILGWAWISPAPRTGAPSPGQPTHKGMMTSLALNPTIPCSSVVISSTGGVAQLMNTFAHATRQRNLSDVVVLITFITLRLRYLVRQNSFSRNCLGTS